MSATWTTMKTKLKAEHVSMVFGKGDQAVNVLDDVSMEVARALAVNPDMLFLDEPFGALDSITRLVLRGELLRICAAEHKTIIFVTHDIDEAVQLSDRVVVMSARPAKIQSTVDIDIPHPRDISSSRYLALPDGILGAIGLAHKV